MKESFHTALLLICILLASCSSASIDSRAQNPGFNSHLIQAACNDSLYLALQKIPADSMTKQQYKYFVAHLEACEGIQIPVHKKTTFWVDAWEVLISALAGYGVYALFFLHK